MADLEIRIGSLAFFFLNGRRNVENRHVGVSHGSTLTSEPNTKSRSMIIPLRRLFRCASPNGTQPGHRLV